MERVDKKRWMVWKVMWRVIWRVGCEKEKKKSGEEVKSIGLFWVIGLRVKKLI